MYIINADDYGISEENNKAILEASKFGILKSTSVMVNTPYCNYDILQELLDNPDFRVGLHLNIYEFNTLKKDLKHNSKLYDNNGEFHNSFGYVLKNSFDKEFLEEVEEEYRLQIEEGLKHFKPEHIDSHVHMHAIPNLFKIVCKLAKEYDIPLFQSKALVDSLIHLEIDEEIPPTLYKAVVEVFIWLYQTEQKAQMSNK